MDVTYLVVLDGEHDETVGVLLEEGLSSLHGLDSFGLGKSLLDGLLDGVDLHGGRDIFLANGGEVELLDGGVRHLEVLEGGSSLMEGIC